MRKLALLWVLLVVAPLSGCISGAGGSDYLYRVGKHIEWHFLKFYKQFVNFHVEVDRYFFDLDEEDPDAY